MRRQLLTGLLFLLAFSTLPLAQADANQGGERGQPIQAGQLASGTAHSCAISGNGTMRCWGNNAHGELGYGNTNTIGDNETPASVGPVNLGPGRTAVVTAGSAGRNCAILDNGTVRCWGNGAEGALGYGNINNIGDDETPGSVGTVDIGAGRTATAISSGEAFSCVILDNGTVRCWGFGSFGALGYGNTNNIGDNETPGSVGTVDIGAGRTATALASGNGYNCVILDNGTVRCWGFGPPGGLGYGNKNTIGDNETPGSVGPVNLGVGRTAVAIAAGNSHTCVILDTGAVKCWGKGENGRLGYGNTNEVLDPSTVGTVDLGEGRTAVAIAGGGTHTCAILDNGSVRCWGEGAYGQLGYGNGTTIGDNETPGSVGPVNLGAGRTAVAITAGNLFTCARLDNGTVKCWGEAAFGQIGYGNTERIGNDETPAAVGTLDLGSGSGALETVAGGTHSCARFDNGTVRCWGNGANGRLGYGNIANIGDNENVGVAGTVDLGGHGAVQIVAGENHTCTRLDDGTVRCWGLGSSGQLGLGNTKNIGDDETPASVSTVSLGGSAIQIAAGTSHTCALLSDSTVRCWGLNGSGQLGYANTTTIGDNEAPSSVGPVALGGPAVEISAGGSHACARLVSGVLRCWGLNGSGQLGYANTTTIGDNENPSAAGPVSLGASPGSVTNGGSHSCATLIDGTVRCWGLNGSGQLGLGNTTTIGDNETPAAAGLVSLGGGLNAAMISAGESHTCAVLSDGTVRCWGAGSDGRLGYGNTTTIGDNETPSAAGSVNLGSGLNALSVSAGGGHTCATLTNGTVRCWGLNSSGQLGLGNTTTIGDDETPGTVGPADFFDDPPVAVNDSKTVAEDASATAIDVLANDTDIDTGPKSVASKTDGAHGVVAITGGGTGLTYTPAANYCGPDSFTYSLNGGSTATVSVTVTCVDDPPVAVNDSKTVAEDASATAIDVLANDTDIDAGPKTVASKTDGAHGVVAITGGGTGLTYTPAANYCGADSFTYSLNGGSTATVSVTVSCVDDLPVAVNDSKTLTESAPATAIDVLANDTDIDGGPKSIASKTEASHGTVVITGGGSGLTYQPTSGYCGPESFTYTLNGGSTAVVSVTVTCVDDPPHAVNDSTTVVEDSGANAIDVLANDTDIDAGPKTVASKTDGAHGVVAITGGGIGISYTPAANYCGADSFTYTLNGGSTATVSVTVTCVDDLPVAVNDSKTVAEDASATAIDVLANDTDIDAGPKTVASKTDGAHGTVAITGGGAGLTYTPAANYCGADSFTYTLNGGSTATVSVTVTCVDDLPVAVNDSKTVAEDASATAIDVLANDTDVDAGPKSIASKTEASHGTVAITGGGTGFTYTPAANYCGADSFTYSLNGGSTATVSVTVTCVDDSPSAVNDSKTVAEDASATAIDVLANDTDIDAGPKSIASKTDGAHGVVAITGGGTGLTYTPAANYCGADSFTYSLNGGSTATVSVTVTCVDDPPSATDNSSTVVEDSGANAIDVLANDTDIDGGPKTIESKTNGAHGTVAITGGGTGLTYTPAANYCGADSFTYSLNGDSTATVSVTVSCVDDLPVAANDADTVVEDSGANAIDVLANDTDIDGGPKTIESKTNGAHGTVAIIGGGTGLTYTPAANYCGADSFTYTLNGGSTAIVSVTVSCVDDLPVAVNDSKTLTESAPATAIDVLANDTDVDGGAKSIASKTEASHGTVAITGGGSGLTYVPDPNYCGADSFTYSLNGGSTATVSVTVTCVDDPPVSADDSETVVEDSGANAIDVLANDTDIDGGPKTIDSKTNGAHGTVAIIGGGIGLSYTPASNYCGADSFTYSLNGGSTATVSVTVTCVDDPPVSADDSETVVEDSGANAIDVLANDTDIDGGPKTIESKTNGAHGTVAITGGGTGLTYLPDPNYCGADSFTYTLNGGSVATVTVTVSCDDDSPVAVDDSATLTEDASATGVNVLANDIDTDTGPKTITSTTDSSHGTVAITGGGAGLTYQPDHDYCGPDSFTYTLNEGSTATVSVTVTCVDDPPSATDNSTTIVEDSGANAIDVLANDTDIDGGPKTIESKTNGAHGTVAVIGGGAGLTYQPDHDYCGADSFTYSLNGGSTATVSVTVTCVDDSPSAVNDSKTVAEDASATAIDVLANDTDIDTGPKSVASKTDGAHGVVAITGGGTGLTYTPAANYCGPDSFTYSLNGGSTATVSVTVTCVDDPPVAVNDSKTVAEDASATAIDVLANDTDVDAGPKSIASKTEASHGTVAITGGGTGLTYTPAASYCGPDSFTYTLNGGSTAIVSITVNCVDDPPTAANDADTVIEDSGASAIDVLANDTNIDGGPISIIGRINGAHGTVSIIGAGAGLTYQPDHDYCGPDSFTYTLNGGSTATVSITVNCVDEPAPPAQGGSQPIPVPSQTIIPVSPSSGPVVNITPGVGVVSGRRHPRIAIKGNYTFFTLTCKLPEGDCAGTVTITATIPSVTLGPTAEKLLLIKGRFRIGAGRSVLVRAKITKEGSEALEAKRTLRGVAARMAIVDTGNGEQGEIDVNLVRRPRASFLAPPARSGRTK